MINKCESVGLDHYDDPKTFIQYSKDRQVVNKNIEEYNLGNICEVLIVFDDMIADMIHNKILNPLVTELFIRGRNWNISIVSIMKILHQRELQQLTLKIL